MESEYVKKQMTCYQAIQNSFDNIERQVARMSELSDALKYIGNYELATKIESIAGGISFSVDNARKSYGKEITNYVDLDQKSYAEFMRVLSE